MTNWRTSGETSTRPSGPVSAPKKPITNEPTTLMISVPHGNVSPSQPATSKEQP